VRQAMMTEKLPLLNDGKRKETNIVKESMYEDDHIIMAYIHALHAVTPAKNN
jgi:hypothetical protein